MSGKCWKCPIRGPKVASLSCFVQLTVPKFYSNIKQQIEKVAKQKTVSVQFNRWAKLSDAFSSNWLVNLLVAALLKVMATAPVDEYKKYLYPYFPFLH